MRLLAVVHKYPPIHNAGAEWMLHAILVDFIRRGHEATVVFEGTPTYELDGVLVTETPRNVEELAREVDVIVTHLDRTQQAVAAAMHTARPLVHLVHNDRQLQYHNVAPGPGVLAVANSEWIARTIDPRYRVVICRPPVFVADYELAGVDLEARDRTTLVNLTNPKGVDTFYALAEANRDRLFLGVAGAYGIQDRRRARRLRNVELLENTPEIARDVYVRTRVLLMPSSYESWGRVGIEAACSGVPTIAHPTDGLLEALGPAGIFVDRRKFRLWQAELERLDDPDQYAEASNRARARALELERITSADLDRLEGAILTLAEDRRRGNVDAYDQTSMILDSVRSGLRCSICHARSCSCGAENAGDGRRGLRIVERTTPRGGGPYPVYRTWRGDFRLAPAAAVRAGLLPGEDDDALPRQVVDRLGFDGELLDRARTAYAGGSMDARRDFLRDLAVLTPRALLAGAPELVDTLEESPPGPPPRAVIESDETVAAARVGDVLEWAGSDPKRIREALERELDGRNRKTLVAELERRLEEVSP